MTPRDERKAMAEKSRTPRATTARGALDAESAGSGRAEVNGARLSRVYARGRSKPRPYGGEIQPRRRTSTEPFEISNGEGAGSRGEREVRMKKSKTLRATTARGAHCAESVGFGRAQVNGGRFSRGLRPRAEQAPPLRP